MRLFGVKKPEPTEEEEAVDTLHSIETLQQHIENYEQRIVALTQQRTRAHAHAIELRKQQKIGKATVTEVLHAVEHEKSLGRQIEKLRQAQRRLRMKQENMQDTMILADEQTIMEQANERIKASLKRLDIGKIQDRVQGEDEDIREDLEEISSVMNDPNLELTAESEGMQSALALLDDELDTEVTNHFNTIEFPVPSRTMSTTTAQSTTTASTAGTRRALRSNAFEAWANGT